ncbi:MAG: TolC family protein [Arcobacter sp.]|uniref:RND family efflux system, outer membrane channel protein, TolC family n=1 Tax=Arcobacter defluvii TaxID=873191 RepID=A0AAE7E6I8_9BACT|nr:MULTISPECIES: TolC family protein [Arcobacter]MDY3201354.1 TolC family protein [Arcobacter sp.]QKF77031.1 RND family efflux system, outer membrane channel protein, TolC family [Arcobacter defluvii]RXI29796.1 transporter [Arcobacter defluvii]
MKKIYFIFLTPLFLYSQNLEELVNLSIQNRLVNASQQSLDSIKDEYKSVKSGYLPKLDVGGKYAITDEETASLAKKSGNVYGSLNYLLYDGGKKSDVYDSYESTIKSTEESVEALKNDISLTVINYYFDYLSLISQKDAKLKEIEQLDSQMERLSRFLKAGTTTEDEVQKIISRVENAKVNLQEIELQIITILHNLEYITGTKIDITAGSNIKESEKVSQNSERFDIKSLEFDLQTKLSNSRAEKSGYLPTVTLDNTYTYYDSNFDDKAYENNAIDHQNILSANLKWNIFSFGETKYKYESKYKEYLASKLKYEYEKNKANVDLQLALKAYDIAKAKIKSAEANLKAAESAYEVIKSKYENGLIDNVAYLESLTEKFDAISQLKTSINDLEIKKANIIYHNGEKLEEYIK